MRRRGVLGPTLAAALLTGGALVTVAIGTGERLEPEPPRPPLALPAVAPPEPVDTPMVVPRLLQVSRPIPPAATWLRKHPQPPCDQDGRRGRGR